ncbi:cytochrome P450 6k1-like, partial [Odontomachus brunneus]|uniref:cytochrome P450 6k1-like n=1 Tax=Odontomachus brunneus TaxID=486640 RepID=UPI0013F209ED
FDGDDLVAQAAIFFSGGFETSSSTISFTLYELAVQPKIQDRLRKEILDAFKENNGKITYDMVLSPYLHMVISETLRKYPILPMLDRETVQNYKVPNTDLVIEKDTPVFISLIDLHYNPEYFPDPDKFDPERFSEENFPKIPPCVYMPFGEDPRKCI